MIVRKAEKAGFCYGVSRAVEMARSVAEKAQDAVYTLGPIIHNAHVVAALKNDGIEPVSIEEVSRGDTVVIRSHGAGPHVYQRLNEIGCQIVDATCPFVLKAQELVSEYVRDGYQVVVLGNPDHPEVSVYKELGGTIVKEPEDIEHILLADSVAVLAQTTENLARFNKVVE